jgi:hypothetical protein
MSVLSYSTTSIPTTFYAHSNIHRNIHRITHHKHKPQLSGRHALLFTMPTIHIQLYHVLLLNIGIMQKEITQSRHKTLLLLYYKMKGAENHIPR